MSEPSKLKILAWRFFFWIPPRWLSRKYQVYMLRRIVERYPAEVDHKSRETARAMAQRFGETGPTEEELVAYEKRCLDSILHPQADAQGSSKSGHIGSAEKTMPIPLQLRENCLKDCLDDLAKRWQEAFQRRGARLETEFEPSIRSSDSTI